MKVSSFVIQYLERICLEQYLFGGVRFRCMGVSVHRSSTVFLILHTSRSVIPLSESISITFNIEFVSHLIDHRKTLP